MDDVEILTRLVRLRPEDKTQALALADAIQEQENLPRRTALQHVAHIRRPGLFRTQMDEMNLELKIDAIWRWQLVEALLYYLPRSIGTDFRILVTHTRRGPKLLEAVENEGQPNYWRGPLIVVGCRWLKDMLRQIVADELPDTELDNSSN